VHIETWRLLGFFLQETCFKVADTPCRRHHKNSSKRDSRHIGPFHLTAAGETTAFTDNLEAWFKYGHPALLEYKRSEPSIAMVGPCTRVTLYVMVRAAQSIQSRPQVEHDLCRIPWTPPRAACSCRRRQEWHLRVLPSGPGSRSSSRRRLEPT
jgi:hypothetical protein